MERGRLGNGRADKVPDKQIPGEEKEFCYGCTADKDSLRLVGEIFPDVEKLNAGGDVLTGSQR